MNRNRSAKYNYNEEKDAIHIFSLHLVIVEYTEKTTTSICSYVIYHSSYHHHIHPHWPRPDIMEIIRKKRRNSKKQLREKMHNTNLPYCISLLQNCYNIGIGSGL
jgi:hypothetical protein